MRNEIIKRLIETEKAENIKILLAVESGSRAWGFESADSDYDVRFIYIRPKNEYLRLDRNRDIIELPLDKVFDINGWDLDKTLKLLYKSNPVLFEWFSSPFVYIETEFVQKFRKIMYSYFSSKRGLNHYLHMSMSNYREYLRTDIVKAKKYFYVLRPMLACKWILEKGTPPPMLFSELTESQLEPTMKPEVDFLLDIKINSPELKTIPKIDTLNAYIEKNLSEIKEEIQRLPDEKPPQWETLNNLFLETINEQ